jgi:hypothetical protein
MSALTRDARSDSIPDISFLAVSETKLLPGEAPKMTEFKRKELNGEFAPEPMLQEDKTRFVLFPIKHADVSSYNSTHEVLS